MSKYLGTFFELKSNEGGRTLLHSALLNICVGKYGRPVQPYATIDCLSKRKLKLTPRLSLRP